MKMKVFTGDNIMSLENEINVWLKNITQIDHVTYAQVGLKFIITVWHK
jgi:hypothetical protein